MHASRMHVRSCVIRAAIQAPSTKHLIIPLRLHNSMSTRQSAASGSSIIQHSYLLAAACTVCIHMYSLHTHIQFIFQKLHRTQECHASFVRTTSMQESMLLHCGGQVDGGASQPDHMRKKIYSLTQAMLRQLYRRSHGCSPDRGLTY